MNQHSHTSTTKQTTAHRIDDDAVFAVEHSKMVATKSTFARINYPDDRAPQDIALVAKKGSYVVAEDHNGK